jgi:hypothetical protein
LRDELLQSFAEFCGVIHCQCHRGCECDSNRQSEPRECCPADTSFLTFHF